MAKSSNDVKIRPLSWEKTSLTVRILTGVSVALVVVLGLSGCIGGDTPTPPAESPSPTVTYQAGHGRVMVDTANLLSAAAG
jgi:hypothetical protein